MPNQNDQHNKLGFAIPTPTDIDTAILWLVLVLISEQILLMLLRELTLGTCVNHKRLMGFASFLCLGGRQIKWAG